MERDLNEGRESVSSAPSVSCPSPCSTLCVSVCGLCSLLWVCVCVCVCALCVVMCDVCCVVCVVCFVPLSADKVRTSVTYIGRESDAGGGEWERGRQASVCSCCGVCDLFSTSFRSTNLNNVWLNVFPELAGQ